MTIGEADTLTADVLTMARVAIVGGYLLGVLVAGARVTIRDDESLTMFMFRQMARAWFWPAAVIIRILRR